MVAYLGDHPDAKVVSSGYHDASGNPARNAELSWQRTLRVHDALKSAGVADSQIVLEKPRDSSGTGDKTEARRVDVALTP